MREVLLIVTAVLMIGACATPQTRSEKYAVAFSGLSEKDKALVLDGKIREGLSDDGVLIALGKPSKIEESVYKGKKHTFWIYTRLVTYTVPGYHYAAYGCRDDVILSRVYSPHYVTRSEEDFEVMIEDGHVVGWRDL